MTYHAHESDVQISHAHNAALSAEIGERLGASLDETRVAMPPHLIMLMARFRDEPGTIRPDQNR
jgi:hypothetical protein